ncbi:predicted protein [Naegleria gruberi]|uniref:Predicted protein n=1 Tax=Naegleria gruberi TaxID=5762 RepID=D2VNG6_NAEGR|nr:uncharacterized protein NAEGRDRAFT_80644 [Naegleria gruberi]EFC41658.1 predicted protein [Naegleria gruberi]|eukprot:XP_002674402.1 predicted protein [Naegleria gruberi strain NEG-M]
MSNNNNYVVRPLNGTNNSNSGRSASNTTTSIPSAPPLESSSPTTQKQPSSIVHNIYPPVNNFGAATAFPNNNTSSAASTIYPKLPDQQLSVNQHLYNIQKQHQRPSNSNNNSTNNGSSQQPMSKSSVPNTSTKKTSKKNEPSSAKILYDSSSQLISGISSYVKSIPWTNIAKQFNENVIQPYSTYVSSAIGSGISITNNTSGGDMSQCNSDTNIYTSHLGRLIWSDLRFLPVTDSNSTDERLFMILAFTNGFQIFDINDPNNVREIITSSSDEWELNKESISEIIGRTMNVVSSANNTDNAPTTNGSISNAVPENNFEQTEQEENSIENSGPITVMNSDLDRNQDHSSFFNLDYVDHDYEEISSAQPTNPPKSTLNIDDWYNRMLDDSDYEEEYSLDQTRREPTKPASTATTTTPLYTPEKVKETKDEVKKQPESVTPSTSQQPPETEEPTNREIYYPEMNVPDTLGPIKMATLLSRPSKKAIKRSEKRAFDQPSYLNYYPLVAVVTETEPNIVHLYSLKYQCFLDDSVKIYCHNPNTEKVTVFQTVSSEDSFIVSDSSGQIFFLDPCTFNLLSQGVCFPSPDNFTKNYSSENDSKKKRKNQKKRIDPKAYGGIIACRNRFAAFASGTEVLNAKLDFTTRINSTLTERSWEVAKKAATGIYMLGDLGLKKVSKYWFEDGKKKSSDSESGSDGSNDNSEDEGLNDEEASFSSLWNGDIPQELLSYQQTVGTVEIRDLKTNRVLMHFRAHNEPIAAMAFDRTGTLLCTAPISGKYLNVFQILPNCYGANGDSIASEKNVKLLYRLYRGLTSAHIQDIHFSVNSKWVAACSARGTIHLYAINPTGGPIDPRFHFNGEQENQSANSNEPIVLNVIARIHDPTAGKRTNSLGQPLTQTRSVFQLYALPEIKSQSTIEASEKFSTEEDLYWERQNATINNENILVTLNCGMLSYYLLKPQLKKRDRAASAENLSRTTVGTASSGISMVAISSDRPVYSPEDFELSLNVELLARFDTFQPQFTPQELAYDALTGQPTRNEEETVMEIQRKKKLHSITWNQLLGKVNEMDTTYQARYVDETQDMLSKWISNVELETHSYPTNPLWATGHFKFKTIKSNSDILENANDNTIFKIGDNDYDQISDISKSLYIKVSNPIPLNHAENFLQDDPKPETVKSDVIIKAITTPISQPPTKITVPLSKIAVPDSKKPTIIPQPILNTGRNKSPVKQFQPQVKIVEEKKTIIDSIVDGEVSSEEDEEVSTVQQQTDVPYVGKSFFGDIQPQQQPTVQYTKPKDLKEDNLLFFSHMENYFDKSEREQNGETDTTVRNGSESPETKPTLIPNHFSLSSSIHQDYFNDEEDAHSELERREQFLNTSLLKESIMINHLEDDDDDEEKLDEYFN